MTAIDTDDRQTCRACHDYQALSGRCRAVQAGELFGTSRFYQPFPDRLWRCEGFRPLPQDEDRRTGLQRWPGLVHPEMKTLKPWQPEETA